MAAFAPSADGEGKHERNVIALSDADEFHINDGDDEFESKLIDCIEKGSFSTAKVVEKRATKSEKESGRRDVVESKCNCADEELNFGDDDDEFETSLVQLVDQFDDDDVKDRSSFDHLYEHKLLPYLRHQKIANVTDLINQFWCERQFSYSIILPHLQDLGTEIQIERQKVMMTGSNIHLARELEIHDVIPVVCTTLEDKWAVKLINCIQGFVLLRGKHTVRELPVFGKLDGLDILVSGIIDEVRWRDDQLVISELKTRKTKSKHLPALAQQAKNSYQVAIYKQLFDQMVLGLTAIDQHAEKAGVSLDAWINLLPLQFMLKDFTSAEYMTVRRLANALRTTIQAVRLPLISSAILEYNFPEIPKCGSLFAEVDFNDIDLKRFVERAASFWNGTRQPDGVDIEDAWKCLKCDFADVCEWKEKKMKECQRKNAKNRSQVT